MRRIARVARRKLNAFGSTVWWHWAGRPAPPPPHVKHAFLRRIARRNRLRVFVETGTFYGDTLEAMRDLVDELHSIELSAKLYQAARLRFAGNPKIRLWHGDSGEVLGTVLNVVRRPALFWLDGHYSMGETARGSEDTPIRRELSQIANHPLRLQHVVVIDDARCFCGANGYPDVADLKAFSERLGFRGFQIVDDLFVLQ